MITLATLQDATKQQIFDQVAAHLLKQNQKCMSLEDSQCAYRGGEDNALKCAAGCLISDDEYKPEMDRAGYIDNICYGSNWANLVLRGLVPKIHVDFIMGLQQLHDSNDPVTWELRLNNFAKQHNLTPIV